MMQKLENSIVVRLTYLLFILKLPDSILCSCHVPEVWHGEYFHLGFSSPLVVSGGGISEKGVCIENTGSQFIMEDSQYGEKCWRCMNIFRKHHNVLQYKESYCETYFDTFESLCLGIGGDSPMYSMFRKEPQPVKCPFRGPFSFGYSKGGSGESCDYPRSYLDSCSDNTKLQLNFQACADVQGSESSAEELQCLATWKEGSKRYLVAEMNREHVYSDETRYRCFVYEKKGRGDNQTVRMAQSVAATCNGLWSPTEGYRTFDIRKVPAAASSCALPQWFTSRHTWSTLDSLVSVHVNKRGRSFKLKNQQDVLSPEESHVNCHSVVKTEKNIVKIVSYVKSGCDSGFMCSVFTKKSDNVVAVQFGYKAKIPSEACSNLYFPGGGAKSVLLIARTNSLSVPCPLSGRYQLSLLSEVSSLSSCSSSLTLVAGCGTNLLEIESSCGDSASFSCHSHWRQGPVTRMILSKKDSGQVVCLSYNDNAGSVSEYSCDDKMGQFNMTQTGPCLQALSSVSAAHQLKQHSLITAIIFIYYSLI